MPFDLIKTLAQYLLPKHGLTTLAGYLGDVKNVKVKNYIIRQFISKYQVNMCEALIEDPSLYLCFNDFFIRQLKPECRPLAQADITAPVDGCISEIGSIEQGQLIQAKGHNYSVAALLACNEKMATHFINGHFATLYLSPKDYHRVHMPMDAEIISMTYLPGALFSVKPSTVRVIPGLFARNERLAVFFSTPLGLMVMVLVGATIVGAIGTSWHGDIKRSKNRVDFKYQDKKPNSLAQGEEMGYFKLGSTVVLLFANDMKVQWNKELVAGTSIRWGEALGSLGP
jgi:phosphatidylserine decarboxylase